jgi:hypothetical protein
MELDCINLGDFANTKTWKELEKAQDEKMLMFRLGHLNPEYNIDSEYGQANKILKQEKKGNVVETTSTVGISTKKGKLSEYHDVMIQYAQMGLLGDFTVEKMQKHRENMNKDMPEECDLWTDISVTRYTDEKAAFQALENLVNQFTKGFVNLPIPGASENMTVQDVFKNPFVIEEAKKRGVDVKDMEKTLEEIEKVSQQAVNEVKKSNVKYKLGKFNKYSAVYCFPPLVSNTKGKPKKQNLAKKETGGGGGYDSLFKLPPNAYDKEEYPISGKLLQAIQVKNYLLTGSILTALHCIPSGKLYCQSLTEFRTVTQTKSEGGIKYIDHFIVPIDSNLKKEGYATREEVEDMIMELISML